MVTPVARASAPQVTEPTLDKSLIKQAAKYPQVFYYGPLWNGSGPKPSDVYQQELNDCPVCAVAAATADMRPDAIKAMMTGNNGHYGVKFARNHVTQMVDGNLYTYAKDALIYGGGSAAHHQDPASMTMWFAMLQKAYAMQMSPDKSKPSYDAINNGMDPVSLWTNWFGWKTFESPKALHYQKADALWAQISYATKNKCPSTLTTFGRQPDYSKDEQSGVIGDHTYSVIATQETADKTRWVKIRNPWGSVVPPGTGPDGQKNNNTTGFFWLKLEDVQHYYDALQVGFPPKRLDGSAEPGPSDKTIWG